MRNLTANEIMTTYQRYLVNSVDGVRITEFCCIVVLQLDDGVVCLHPWNKSTPKSNDIVGFIVVDDRGNNSFVRLMNVEFERNLPKEEPHFPYAKTLRTSVQGTRCNWRPVRGVLAQNLRMGDSKPTFTMTFKS